MNAISKGRKREKGEVKGLSPLLVSRVRGREKTVAHCSATKRSDRRKSTNHTFGKDGKGGLTEREADYARLTIVEEEGGNRPPLPHGSGKEGTIRRKRKKKEPPPLK